MSSHTHRTHIVESFKCSACHERISVEEYLRGYCTASRNSFHQVSKYDYALGLKAQAPDAHLGAVGGE